MGKVKTENHPRYFVVVVCPDHPRLSREKIQVTAQRARSKQIGICRLLDKQGLPCMAEKRVIRVFSR